MQNQLSGKKVSSSKGSKRPAKSGSKSQSIQMVVHTYAGSITENNQTHQEDNFTVAEQSEKILKTTSPCASMEHTSKEELSEKHGGTHIQDRPSKKKPLTTNEIQNSDQASSHQDVSSRTKPTRTIKAPSKYVSSPTICGKTTSRSRTTKLKVCKSHLPTKLNRLSKQSRKGSVSVQLFVLTGAMCITEYHFPSTGAKGIVSTNAKEIVECIKSKPVLLKGISMASTRCFRVLVKENSTRLSKNYKNLVQAIYCVEGCYLALKRPKTLSDLMNMGNYHALETVTLDCIKGQMQSKRIAKVNTDKDRQTNEVENETNVSVLEGSNPEAFTEDGLAALLRSPVLETTHPMEVIPNDIDINEDPFERVELESLTVTTDESSDLVSIASTESSQDSDDMTLESHSFASEIEKTISVHYEPTIVHNPFYFFDSPLEYYIRLGQWLVYLHDLAQQEGDGNVYEHMKSAISIYDNMTCAQKAIGGMKTNFDQVVQLISTVEATKTTATPGGRIPLASVAYKAYQTCFRMHTSLTKQGKSCLTLFGNYPSPLEAGVTIQVQSTPTSHVVDVPYGAHLAIAKERNEDDKRRNRPKKDKK